MMTEKLKGIGIDELFGRVAEKDDEDALRILFFQFYAPLCVFAGRYVDSRMVCEDIVQDVFARIWERRRHILVASSFRNFIVTMVRNACIDHLRREEQACNWRQWRMETGQDSCGDIYTMQELQDILEKALEKLPDNVRASFVMSRFEGKKYAEIAAERQVSVKTVEAHISKALRLLRVELKDFLPMLLLLMRQ